MNINDSIIGVRLTPGAQVKLGHRFDQMTGTRGRDLLLKMVALVALASATLEPIAVASDDRQGHWTGTWAAAPAFAKGNTQYTDQTLRMIVHTSLAGSQVRVRFSNAFGSHPLKIGAAHIALRDSLAKIVVNSDRSLTFKCPWRIDTAARLHSAIGYVTPKDMLAGRQVEIHIERDRKLEAARQQRHSRRQQAA